MHSNKHITINECEKNIQDIDKIVKILQNNKYIKDDNIIPELKNQRDNYVIKLFELNNDFKILSSILSIEDMEYDFENRYVKIIFEMNDGTLLEKLFPLKRLEVHNGRSDYVFE